MIDENATKSKLLETQPKAQRCNQELILKRRLKKGKLADPKGRAS